jgi:DNA modification methylase
VSNFLLLNGDARALPFADKSVHCCVTSPPYFGLRDYGVDGQLGLEKTPEEYVAGMVAVFREVKRCLRDDGTLWLNIGDSYASASKGSGGPSAKQLSNSGSRYAPIKLHHGVKDKDLIGIPWMLAFALRADGWYLRSDIIWHKPNPMPESVTDRPTKAHEYVFLLSKSQTYYYDADAIAEQTAYPVAADRRASGDYSIGAGRNDGGLHRSGGFVSGNIRNKRTVWTVTTQPYAEAHFATYPPALIEPCILAGCPVGGVVLDPFTGSGTTGEVAIRNGRSFVGTELNPDYITIAKNRIGNAPLSLFGVA